MKPLLCISGAQKAKNGSPLWLLGGRSATGFFAGRIGSRDPHVIPTDVPPFESTLETDLRRTLGTAQNDLRFDGRPCRFGYRGFVLQ